MNPEEARTSSVAPGGALTLAFDEVVPEAKPKATRKRVAKKDGDAAPEADQGDGEAPVKKPRARATTAKAPATPRVTKAAAAKAAAESAIVESGATSPSSSSATPATPQPLPQAPAPYEPAPTPRSAAPYEPIPTVAPAPIAPTAAIPAPARPPMSFGAAPIGERISHQPSPADAGGPTVDATPVPQAQPPYQPTYQPRGRYTTQSGEGTANPHTSYAPRQGGPGFRGSYGGGPIVPAADATAPANIPTNNPGDAPAAGPIHEAPANVESVSPSGPDNANYDPSAVDFQNTDQRNYQRDPLRFRGGRAQMRADRNLPRGRHLRPGQPGYVQGGPNNNGGAEPNFNGGNQGNLPNNQGNNQGNNRGRREYDLLALEAMALAELHKLAEEMGVEVPPLKKEDLIHTILGKQAELIGNVLKKGILEILSDGKGFLRCNNYVPDDGDVYVSQSQIKRFNLKTGDTVTGTVRQPKEMERYHGLLRVEAINGLSPETMRSRRDFEKLTPIFPTEKFQLETDQSNITARIIDLVSPIGKGQRGLIVAPPKAGKTTLIKNVANSIMSNHPEVMLIVLLIDERPEEVTDISRSVRGEVVASTFDEMPENHMRVADMVLEKAKRWVELKHDVVILMDSITRLSRASNLVVAPSGRTLSGGLDPAAMYRPKRMFGAARNIEEGGSLTILATALVDTGSRMDEMIFEEFKGTGNMDLVLDRNLFDQRIFPAIDINKSGTRRDDLLMGKEELAAIYHLRRTLSALDNDKAVTLLIDRLKNTKTNADFMQIVAKSRVQAASQQ